MILVFLHGLPGVGKYTVGRELEALTGYPLFHNHVTVDLVTTLFEFGSDDFVDLREHIWLEAFGRAARAGLPGMIFTFAAERTVRDDFVERAVAAVTGAGGEVVFVELTCAERELRTRVVDPDRRRFGKLDSIDLLERLVADGTIFRLEPPGAAPRFSIDTTDRPPAVTAAEIAGALPETEVS